MTRTSLASGDVFERLSTLSDETRARLLLLLEEQEYTVSELCQALQLPQSTVSRHLKVLLDDGWVRSRTSGTSRHYRMAELGGAMAELWAVVRAPMSEAASAEEDAERARSVLAHRRARSQAFFSTAAADWDRLRDELFGRESALLPLFGFLDASWEVADLGAGTGALAARIAPFVRRVHAVDSSPEMLEALGSRVGALSNVDVHRGELESLPLATERVDVAVMLLVLHYVPEPRRALSEAFRVLRPGGRLVVVDMREHEREEYRAEMGHVWPGFGRAQLEAWSARAGFQRMDWAPVSPDPEARGPLLFVARLVKRSG
jgi:ArsR family transcriptional regulator